MEDIDPNKVYNVPQSAKLIGTYADKVHELISEGRLKYFVLSQNKRTHRRIRGKWLLEFMEKEAA